MKDLFKRRDENIARVEELKIGIEQLNRVITKKSDLPGKVKEAREKLDEAYFQLGKGKIDETELEKIKKTYEDLNMRLQHNNYETKMTNDALTKHHEELSGLQSDIADINRALWKIILADLKDKILQSSRPLLQQTIVAFLKAEGCNSSSTLSFILTPEDIWNSQNSQAPSDSTVKKISDELEQKYFKQLL